jgi:hypothetical protein
LNADELPPLGVGDPREVESEPLDYHLLRLAGDRLVMAVVANQSAFYYFIKHELTPAEIASYRQKGKAYLSSLAKRLRYHRVPGVR